MADTTDNYKPLRVLHLTAGSDAGGLSRYIFDLCSAMHAQGHQVSVAGQRGAWHWLFESAPFPWIDAPLKGGIFTLRKAAKTLSQWIADHPVDLLHVHYRRTTLVGRRIQKIHPLPMLYTLHQPNLQLTWPWRALSDFGDHTHVASDEARDWLIQDARVPGDRISVVPHGVDAIRFPFADEATKAAAKQAMGFAADHTVAAYVGRMDIPKNEDWMLDLAAASRTRLPNLKIVMVGEGPHQIGIRRRIEQEHLTDRVTLLGHRDPLPIYQAADALLSPSLREGFSLVCVEAMSTGIPVLRTRTGGTAALIIENSTGRSVPIDREAFVAGAIEFLSDTTNLKRMGKLAAEHVHSHFSYDRQLRETVELYRSLIKPSGSI